MPQVTREAFTRGAVAAGHDLAQAHSLEGASAALARDLGRDIADDRTLVGGDRSL